MAVARLAKHDGLILAEACEQFAVGADREPTVAGATFHKRARHLPRAHIEHDDVALPAVTLIPGQGYPGPVRAKRETRAESVAGGIAPDGRLAKPIKIEPLEATEVEIALVLGAGGFE